MHTAVFMCIPISVCLEAYIESPLVTIGEQLMVIEINRFEVAKRMPEELFF